MWIWLQELKRELEMFMQLKCEMTSVPPMISIQLIPPLKEVIIISIDDLKGMFVVNLPPSGEFQLLLLERGLMVMMMMMISVLQLKEMSCLSVSSFESSLAESLNSDKKDLRHIIFDIRYRNKRCLV